MEEVKSQLRSVSQKQKIEIIALLFVGLLIILALIFLFKYLNRTRVTERKLETLEDHNLQLQKNNERLIKVVESMNSTVTERTKRDSALYEQIEENNEISSTINNRLKNIDAKYEKNINAIRHYTADDIESYIATEGNRLRKGKD